MKLAPTVEVNEADGEARVRISASTEAEARNILAGLAKKRGWDLERVLAMANRNLHRTRETPPAITQKVTIWRPETYRTVAKMACNLFSAEYPSRFRCSSFNAIREFVLSGEGTSPSFVQLTDVDLRNNGLGPVDHYVSVAVGENGGVTGLVALFGVLAFVVNLGRIPHGAKRARHSYRVDQLGRVDRRDDYVDLAIPIEPFDEAVSREFEGFYELAKAQTQALLTEVVRLQRDGWLRRLITPHWNRFIEAHTDATGDGTAWRELAQAVANEVAEELRPQIEEAAQARRLHALASTFLANDQKP